MTSTPLLERSRSSLERTARRLAWFTIVWNVIEAVVSIIAGASSGSLALVGFGVDAVIETGSAVVVLWQFRGDVDESREETALKLIAVSFFALAAYVVFESGRDLFTGDVPETSMLGIAITSLSVIVMPILARAKRRVGDALGSAVVRADAAETRVCTYLSVTVLVGLLANAAFGWWWADPVAALGVAYIAVTEGREAWEGEADCC